MIMMESGENHVAVEDSGRGHWDGLKVGRAGTAAAFTSCDQSVYHRVHGVLLLLLLLLLRLVLVLPGIPGAYDGRIGRIRTTEIVGRRGERRRSNCRWIKRVDRAGNIQIVEGNALGVVVEHEPIKLFVIIFPGEHLVGVVLVAVNVGFHFVSCRGWGGVTRGVQRAECKEKKRK
jgi:hypothetical protein